MTYLEKIIQNNSENFYEEMNICLLNILKISKKEEYSFLNNKLFRARKIFSNITKVSEESVLKIKNILHDAEDFLNIKLNQNFNSENNLYSIKENEEKEEYYKINISKFFFEFLNNQ